MRFDVRVPVLALSLALAPAAPAAVGIEIEVAAGDHDREDTPVVFALPPSLAGLPGFTLKRVDNGALSAVQRLPGPEARVTWVERGRLAANSIRRYQIVFTPPLNRVGEVSVQDNDEAIRFKIGESPVLTYHTKVVSSPEGIEPLYQRSGHIHPLFSPSGIAVTDDFPPDHAHQHGIFFAWANTTFKGMSIDFWNQPKKTGIVAHDKSLATITGPEYGQLAVRLRHDDLDTSRETVGVLNEVWTIRAYRLSTHHIVDLESTQTCAGASPLKINAFHYGGFGIRGNRAWFDDQVKGTDPPDPNRSGRSDFLTSEGKSRRNGNHTRPRWVDLSGEVGGRVAGVAVLDHPDNFRHPQPVRLHPNKPYFCFAPMVLGEFEITPGKPYVSRYRLIVHDGPPDARVIDRLWRDYADPPRVTVAGAKQP